MRFAGAPPGCWPRDNAIRGLCIQKGTVPATARRLSCGLKVLEDLRKSSRASRTHVVIAAPPPTTTATTPAAATTTTTTTTPDTAATTATAHDNDYEDDDDDDYYYYDYCIDDDGHCCLRPWLVRLLLLRLL